MGDLNLFIAALYTNGYLPGGGRYANLNESEGAVMRKCNTRNILESYHYVHHQRIVDNMRENNAKVFLDSGAFSAWTTGATIDIRDYCNYIIRNQDIIRTDGDAVMASVLDAIGDAQGTFENQMAMERLGVRPLPCFHKYEDPRYLEWYVKNYDYITIGGMVGSSTAELIRWLDPLWDKYLTDGAGNPLIKVHAFGVTSIPLMKRYPWHSCDSSSWIQVARFGNIYMRDHGVLAMSKESPARHTAGKHYDNITELERHALDLRLTEQGFKAERLSDRYEPRAAYNVNEFMTINDEINANRVNHKLNMQQGLF